MKIIKNDRENEQREGRSRNLPIQLESCFLFKLWNVLVLLCSSQWLSAQQLAIVATTLNRVAPSVWYQARHTKYETQIKYSLPAYEILRREKSLSVLLFLLMFTSLNIEKHCRLPSSAHRLLEWWECWPWSIARHEVVIIPALKLMFIT